MRQVKIGKVLLTNGGTWSATVGYAVLTFVIHNGDGWWSAKANVNSEPSSTNANWVRATDTESLRTAVQELIDIAEQVETAMEVAEALRVSAENLRVSAEAGRVQAESTRVTNETSRANAEATRESSENERITNENTRKSNENDRIVAERARVSAETARETASETAIAQYNEDHLTAAADHTTAAADAEFAAADHETATEDHANYTADRATFAADEAARQTTFDNNEVARDAKVDEKVEDITNLQTEVTELAREVSTKAEQTDVDASVTDLEDRKANKDGYYTELTAGMAEQLLSPDGITDEVPYLYRTTAGDASVSTGVAEIKQLKGNSLVWNQQLSKNISISANGQNCTITQDTTTGEVTMTVSSDGAYSYKGGVYSVVANHIYIGICDIKADSNNTGSGCTGAFYINGGTYSVSPTIDITTEWKRSCYIGYKSTSMTHLLWINNVKAGDIFYFKNFQLIDLTKMYGSGNEPTTVEEFKADFPLDYYSYNAGTIINVEPNGLKTTGFNLCEVHNLLEGTYTSYANYITDSSTIIEWFKKIQKLGQNVYYTLTADQTQKTGSAQIGYLAFRNSTEGVFKFSISPNGVRDLSSYDFDSVDAVYIYTANGTTTNITDVCFNLVWSGYRNGEYEEYNEHNISLPIKSIKDSDGNLLFPNGLRSAGSVYDEITSTKAIKRKGDVIFNGTETNWALDSRSDGNYFYIPINDRKRGETINTINNLGLSTLAYMTVNFGFLAPNSTITSVDLWKQYLSSNNLELVYELATPIEVDFAETPQDFGTTLNLTYHMDDFGTEEFTTDSDVMSAPVAHSTFYMTNLRDKIRTIDGNTDEGALMNDSLANLLTTLGSALGGTLTRTWNETNANWEFSFTANTSTTNEE